MIEKLCEEREKECCELFLGTDHILLDKSIFKVLKLLERDTLTKVLIEIDSQISKFDDSIAFKTRLTNLGTGIGIYKGYTLRDGHTFKTIKGSNSVTIKEIGDELIFEAEVKESENKQDFDFKSIGEGTEILDNTYKDGNTFRASFRKIRTNDLDVILDGTKSVVINYKEQDRLAISELKTFNFIDYAEIVKNARKLANTK